MSKALGGLAAIVLLLVLALPAFATKPDPEHKVGVCHRTASDTNPYVFIKVDEAAADELGGHLGNTDPGNKPTFWKSDGVWRGVAHLDGDPKDDYTAESEDECNDSKVSPSPTLEPSTSPSPSSSVQPSESPEVTPSPSPSFTSSPSTSPDATETPSSSPSEEPSVSPVPTATPTPSSTPAPSSSPTSSPKSSEPPVPELTLPPTDTEG